MASHSITLNLADDFHHHFRDGESLRNTVPYASRMFKRAIVMPNLKPPITTTEAALEYRCRILSHVPEGRDFMPLMTLYMTDHTSADEIRKAHETGFIFGVKLYPKGATTNSQSGVTDFQKIEGALEAMAELQIPLLVHGEVTDVETDVFDREVLFIENVLRPLVEKYPKLKVVVEHITTKQAAEFVVGCGKNVAATITPQHLMYNRNEIFKGGVRPHLYCLPILKREEHRKALVYHATSGNPKFFLGTDSAPHSKETKENSCGCAGIFNGHAALELYAEIFDSANALEKLNSFCSENGADFYGLKRNKEIITLIESPWTVPETLQFGNSVVVPLKAGETIKWKIRDDDRKPIEK
mmetsp:Transcript_9290/g.13968  ORF Transcript_9290/g.13968 Transcript_9290/m.13968 type:complete len:355 (+) Transcript_9290:13-1077(+)